MKLKGIIKREESKFNQNVHISVKKQRVLGQKLFRFKSKIYVVQILVKKQKVAVLDKSLAFCLLTSGAQREKRTFC